MSDINHRNYHTRLEQIQRITKQHNLQASTITPVAYQELGPCPYNNFIYKLELSEPASSSSFHNPNEPLTPCTTSPPDGTLTYILRMSNPLAMGINPHASRIENEVAAMSLARQGLESYGPGLGSLIPKIYTFCSKPSHPDDLPWVLMEYKSGVPLDEFFSYQSDTIKESIIEQVADILSGLRSCPLPPGITYGGLGLSTDGSIIIPNLSDSDTRVLIHGDLTMNNILIDLSTCKLTALIDFDFACIAHPAHEFLVSLQDLGGNVMGPYGEDPTEGKLSQALLSGDFSDDDVPGDLCDVDGMKVLREWRALELLVCPFHLAAEFIVKRMGEEAREGAKRGGQGELVAKMGDLEEVMGGSC
ncbi:hypothetical protein CBS147343_9265 [Aspergillus niger]|nr:hypothetical protein CBS133816_10241 [Aspergillus niger]KAI2841417.1 hypothetical protein CBS12448_10444 [Aspergillus niger]KAI2908092.1 hypothetical protein CBS147371_10378 [Aspergillus niger]KAI2942711.1 hypothetical protein CBS147322_8775 [Aspergillus niger]KAI2959210.1 hypothetical protein CBS147324_10352 [Aspergillus niger]